MQDGDRAISYNDFLDVRNIIFEMTNACNMRCSYCFEEEACKQNKTGMISWPIIQRAIDSVIIQENEHYMVTFFGGEPLLNKELIFKTIAYAKNVAGKYSSYVSFNMVTNATCLDSQTISSLNAEDVYLFVSFDGDRALQDRYRRMMDGRSSYETVLENLKELIFSREAMNCKDNMAVRMTVTKDGIEQLVDRYQFLCRLGCCKITFALVSSDRKRPYAIGTEDFPLLRKVYWKLADLFIEEVESGKLHNRFFQSLVKKITDGVHCNHFCDCGKRYLGVGIDGDIYPCEGFFGLKQFSTGNILGKRNSRNGNTLECVSNHPFCKQCWARYLCGGGCYHEAWMRTGNVNKKDAVICETYRIAVEAALYIYEKLKQRGLLSVFLSLAEEQLSDSAVPVLWQANCKQQGTLLYSVTEEFSYFIELDEMSEFIVSLCDGKHTLSEIVSILLDLYECEAETLYRDVCHLLNDLHDHKAIYFVNEAVDIPNFGCLDSK